jgi:hypothetical protein
MEMDFSRLFSLPPVVPVVAAATLALAGLLAGCAATGNPPAPRTPNPAVPLAATSSLPEFTELFRQMSKLYADHPQAPAMQEGDGMGQKISIARVRKPGALELRSARLGVNPDDLLDRAALTMPPRHADQVVVQVHGRVAVAGDQPERRPGGHALVGAGRPQDAVLVAAVAVFEFAVGVQACTFGRPESMAWLLWPASQTACRSPRS